MGTLEAAATALWPGRQEGRLCPPPSDQRVSRGAGDGCHRTIPAPPQGPCPPRAHDNARPLLSHPDPGLVVRGVSAWPQATGGLPGASPRYPAGGARGPSGQTRLPTILSLTRPGRRRRHGQRAAMGLCVQTRADPRHPPRSRMILQRPRGWGATRQPLSRQKLRGVCPEGNRGDGAGRRPGGLEEHPPPPGSTHGEGDGGRVDGVPVG